MPDPEPTYTAPVDHVTDPADDLIARMSRMASEGHVDPPGGDDPTDPHPLAPGHLELRGDEWHIRCARCGDSLRSSPGVTRTELLAMLSDWAVGPDGLWQCGACQGFTR